MEVAVCCILVSAKFPVFQGNNREFCRIFVDQSIDDRNFYIQSRGLQQRSQAIICVEGILIYHVFVIFLSLWHWKMRFLAVLLLTLLLSARAISAISSEHRACSSDQDCALVMISCSECCSKPADFYAVNKQYVKEYENSGICTPEHIKACGIPECGLFAPEPYPVAVCRDGVCAVKVHPANPRLQAPAPASIECTEENAIAAIQSDSTFKYFCSGQVNGVSHGCNFKARSPSPLNADEKNDKDLAWVVNASIIHSFDDKGQPRFMPEWTAFAFISKDCKIMKTVSPNGPLSPAPSLDAYPATQPKKFFKDLFLH